ncbi:class III lanthionine synthetase LanKC [Actinokineospora sp. NBRC 105648]|uniref:class III lanthionine synthetase LanKC n=1 Tax=Actinokineospora sp. NBRC 105648 TaxID=3032206 RepID=UPI0024A543F1|nr:class III lanthionine synthetase LanKC [Actinokineospora sp. NBRC 105648]GLZ41208.1 serine/threonine protein kinase [Actinokineospora sp. NBRC 105648]
MSSIGRYEPFCLADRLFYDRPAVPVAAEFVVPLPAGWLEHRTGDWRMVLPPRAELPDQGWKIHVSATLGNAPRVLRAVARYCVDNAIPFKHLRSAAVQHRRNAKYAARAASGKLIAIYPADERQLADTLAALGEVLVGEPGPHVLSDLRVGDGPLYVRYGGFTEKWITHEGARVLAVTTPDGSLVPDVRAPIFCLPEWVDLPDCLRPHYAERGGPPFPYTVDRALHFSNGGGVYLATRDGRQVVLKEGRPHCGLDRDRVDAVTRLRHEYEVLTRLAGIEGVPEVYEHFHVWEHHYVAMEHRPGIPLGKWLARNYPLTRKSTAQEVADYTIRAVALLDRIEALVAKVHERGIVCADLHPRNILVDGDTVSLIDFELALPTDHDGRPALGAPGFQAPADRRGIAIDQHALAALRLWIFLPLTTLLDLAPGKLPGHVTAIERRFPLPPDYGDRIRRAIPATAIEPDMDDLAKSMAVAILASATPDRADRLFPGDIEQFVTGGATFAHGAAGVLYALDAAGAGRYPEHERWLLDYLKRHPPQRPGFFDGAHGIAHVLHRFGYREEAAELIARAVPPMDDHTLGSGLAGIGLNLLHFGDLAGAIALADHLATALPAADPPGRKGRAGLLHGWSGPALLFIHLFERTGDSGWLDLADTALNRDLDECVPTPGGALQVRDGTRTLPYLAIGSAGIAVVLTRLARHAPVTRLDPLLDACAAEFVVQSGLHLGRAGLVTALALAGRPVDLTSLAWHAVAHAGGTAFPGDQLHRLSMDLATGTAGVLLATATAISISTATALDAGRPGLPFLT